MARRERFDRLMDGRHGARRRGRIDHQVGRREPIAFDGGHVGTANDRRSDREESDPRVQVHDVVAGADAADNAGDKVAQ
jgi:hypothetical protein